jgi:hypothetical protein
VAMPRDACRKQNGKQRVRGLEANGETYDLVRD